MFYFWPYIPVTNIVYLGSNVQNDIALSVICPYYSYIHITDVPSISRNCTCAVHISAAIPRISAKTPKALYNALEIGGI